MTDPASLARQPRFARRRPSRPPMARRPFVIVAALKPGESWPTVIRRGCAIAAYLVSSFVNLTHSIWPELFAHAVNGWTDWPSDVQAFLPATSVVGTSEW